jgi:hypothetical protein
VGTLWAFQRGGNDFDVFYRAWSLVLSGHASEIYRNSPDRYLYAPGFAWLLSPFAYLPRDLALALWCFLKAASLGWLIQGFARSLPGVGTRAALGMAALGILLLARPVLIDFEYGQVNLFILGACAWALLTHFNRDAPAKIDLIAWGVLALAGFAKLFPLPLLLIPFLRGWPLPAAKIRREKWGICFGALLVLGIPFISQGREGGVQLFHEWLVALQARGLPMESHNQSFAALLRHFFSGNPTPVISEGWRPIQFGFALFSARTIELLSLAWSLIVGGFLLGWLVSGPRQKPLAWISVLLGLTILPSHLVWKPYFVMAIPAATYLVSRARVDRAISVFLAVFFVAINLTGFNFIGHDFAAHAEAGAFFLIAHVFLLALVMGQSSV